MKDKLIVALDVGTLDKAEYFVNVLSPTVRLFKIGSQLFTAYGPKAIEMVSSKGGRVFLDLKFHDIPHTVFSATGSASSILCHDSDSIGEGIVKDVQDAITPPVFMLTVHTSGGKEMLKAAAEGALSKAKELKIQRPFIVGVTVLTSEEQKKNTSDVVLERAIDAKDSGLDGIVCSVYEARMIRENLGRDFLIVTPGIRPKGYPSHDQSRVATAREALDAGANYIVVGRPILEAKDPLCVLEEILEN